MGTSRLNSIGSATDSAASDLRGLIDRAAIYDCVTRCSSGLDRQDKDLVLSAFHTDALYDHGAFIGPAQELPAVLSFSSAAGRRNVHHHLGSHSCDIDGGVAHAETYFLCDEYFDRDGRVLLTAGRQLDRLERRANSWKIAFRYSVEAWSSSSLANAIPTGCHSIAPGAPIASHVDGQGGHGDLEALRDLLDRQAILDCMVRYTRGIDRLDRELMLSAYHDDAVIDHGDFVGSPEGLFQLSYETNSRYQLTTQLHLSNHTCHLEGDSAHAETYYLYSAYRQGDESVLMASGRYLDKLERRDKEWKIAVRYCPVEWAGTSSAATSGSVSVADRHANGVPSHGRSDPSYLRPLINKRTLHRGASMVTSLPGSACEQKQ